MDDLQNIIKTCLAYKNGDFKLEEFQHRLETIYLPSECKYTLEKTQHDAFNHLEKIFFFYPEEEHKERADKIADQLIQATIEEQERLRKNNLL